MSANKNASRRWIRPNRRQPETIAAEQLIPRLHCITAVGGVQAARRHTYTERLYLYTDAKLEFIGIRRTEHCPCSYEAFIHAVVEALRI